MLKRTNKNTNNKNIKKTSAKNTFYKRQRLSVSLFDLILS